MEARIRLGALFLGAAFLAGWGCMSRPLYDPDESRYAEVAREMWVGGDWVIQRLESVPYIDKPPLLAWLTAPLIGLLGPGELAPRLIPLLAFLATLPMIYFAARRAFGESAAGWTVTVWAFSALPVSLGAYVLTDMLLTCLAMGASLCFWRAREEQGKGALAGWVLMGFAFLAKGPIGIALPMMAVTAHAIVTRKLLWREMKPVRGIALLLAVILPWLIAAEVRMPGFLMRFLFHENVKGFLSDGVHHAAGLPMPIVYLAGGLLPWTPLVIVAMIRERESWKTPQARMLALWASLIVLFFMLNRSKLMTYLAPAVVPVSLLAGAFLARQAPSRWEAIGPIVLFLAVATGSFFVPREQATHWGRVVVPVSAFVAGALVVAGTFSSGMLALGRRRAASAAVLVATLVAARIPGDIAARAICDDVRDARGLVLAHRAELERREVVIVGRTNYSVSYYLQRPVWYAGKPNELEFGLDLEGSNRGLSGEALERFLEGATPVSVFAYVRVVESFCAAHPTFREVERRGTMALLMRD
jgi:4-amino-4-deoxy-L-arabinose transferase-like glycosyltransferase